MRNKPLLLAAAAAAAIAATPVATASAKDAQTHVMMLQLPGGGLARIQYTGDVAPRVTVMPQDEASMAFAPMPVFLDEAPFAALERISAQMDAQMAAMRQQMRKMWLPQSGEAIEAAMKNAPPGSQSYSMVSTFSGNGVCTHTMRVISTGNGKPKVEQSSSGDCSDTQKGVTSSDDAAAANTSSQAVAIKATSGNPPLLHDATVRQSL